MAVEISEFRQNPVLSISPFLDLVSDLKLNRFFGTLTLPSRIQTRASFYDKPSYDQTGVVGFGDSYCAGFVEYNDQGDKISCPPGEYLVKSINSAFGVQWKSRLFAQEGATARQVKQQILANSSALFDTSVNGVDVYLGMLGNDPITAISEEFNPREMEHLTRGLWSPALARRFLGSAKAGILRHENGIRQVVNDLEKICHDGAKIKRLFIQGVPNMGYASKLDLVFDEDQIGPSSSIDLGHKWLLRKLLSGFARLTDWENRRLASGLMAPFRILYINVFHELNNIDFAATHPNVQGYQRTALQIMKLQYAEFGGKSRSFRQEYEKRMPQVKLAV